MQQPTHLPVTKLPTADATAGTPVDNVAAHPASTAARPASTAAHPAPAALGSAAPRPRVALYGHDTLGLGHLRRNLALATTFAADGKDREGADVLLLTGATEIGMFDRPDGVDVLVVPGVRKDDDGGYEPRRLRSRLEDVIGLRRSMLMNALLTFGPDLLVVDKSPWGFAGELADVLPLLRRRGTRLVLGLRDVLDEAATATRQWHADGSEEAVREIYDEVWVYGDREVHDVTLATGMSGRAAAKTHHVGYLAEGRPGLESGSRPCDRPYVLVTVGGGQDGEELARAAAEMPPVEGHDVVVVTGPQMDGDVVSELRALAEERADLQVHRFARNGAAWAANASAVACMGGANTVAEQLVSDAPTLVVPRVHPREEQLVRARALAARGHLAVLHPDDLTPAALHGWLRAHVGVRVDHSGLRLEGLREVRRRAMDLVDGADDEEDAVLAHVTHLAPARARRAG